VVDRRDPSAVATFFCGEPIPAGRVATLGEGEAHHARVVRLQVGDRVRLVDGAGVVAWGSLVRLAKTHAQVGVHVVEHVEPLPVVHLMVPIADRDRMLWLAEKATELGVCSWRPVLWRRSRSVSPRGEGVAFQAKVRARMTSALTQSGGAWLPVIYPDATLDRAIAACPAGARWLLDAEGEPVTSQPLTAPLTVALGPEGGVEPAERADLLAAGFTPVKLAPVTLRFETAGIAALGIVRAALSPTVERARV
jgi:16S rRNA (uracil1498-N3)-methyltransferase